MMVTPKATITLRDIKIDSQVRNFTAELTVRHWRKKGVTRTISGKVSPELRNWLCRKDKHVHITVEHEDGTVERVKTNELTTGFKKYLSKIGKEFFPGILNSLVFKCKNTSPVYNENPFRIVEMADGYTVMTLVNVAPKQKTVLEDPNTGKETVLWQRKKVTLTKEDGTTFVVDDFVPKNGFRRYIHQETEQ